MIVDASWVLTIIPATRRSSQATVDKWPFLVVDGFHEMGEKAETIE